MIDDFTGAIPGCYCSSAFDWEKLLGMYDTLNAESYRAKLAKLDSSQASSQSPRRPP